MNRSTGILPVLGANLVWFLCCFPGYLKFRAAVYFPRFIQLRVLKTILRKNRSSKKLHCLGITAKAPLDELRRIPPSEYEDYLEDITKIRRGQKGILTCEPVRLLEPTSGSASATKLIPYTESLQKEFKRALDPWIAGLFLSYPRLFFGRHYWSISPRTLFPDANDDVVPIGFASDMEYLSLLQRKFAERLFPLPMGMESIKDQDEFDYLTLLFLLRDKNLRMISVWHPSFLTSLLHAGSLRIQSIINDVKHGRFSIKKTGPDELWSKLGRLNRPDAKRAEELEKAIYRDGKLTGRVWPKLCVISCWTEGRASEATRELETLFPGVSLQSKGLVATEGIISISLGKKGEKVCAVTSHFFEFIDAETQGCVPLWEVKTGRTYSLVLTTSGGLYRYRLHDRVRVEGFFGLTPCLSFMGRDNMVCDLVGEKLNMLHVDSIIDKVRRSGFPLHFAMLAPYISGEDRSYTLFVQTDKEGEPDLGFLHNFFEKELCENFHYRHARRLSQLRDIRIFRIKEGAHRDYIHFLAGKGMKKGDIKAMSLRSETEWHRAFTGEFVG